MRRIVRFYTLLISTLILTGLLSSAFSAELTGGELMRQVREKNNSKTQVSNISMELIDKKGRSQERELMIWAEQIGDSENTLTRFVAPKRVKGVGFLVVNESTGVSRYLYTPTEKKTRKVPEGDNKNSFQGTDFTYYDLSPHEVDDDVYAPLKSENYDGHDCWVVTSNPKLESGALYSKVEQWVRKDIYVPIKMKFYDEKGKFLKESKVLDLQKVDGYWTPLKSVMHNVQIDHKTVMTVKRVKYDENIPENVFSKSNLEKGA